MAHGVHAACRGKPHIVKLLATAWQGPKGAEQEAYLLMELCQDNLVEYLLSQRGQVPNSEVAQMFLAACKAVSHLHLQTPPLAHRCMVCCAVVMSQRRAARCWPGPLPA